MRLDVRSQLKTNDGELIAMYYKGTVALTPGVLKVLGGASDAKTTEWGDSFVTFDFETGSSKYKTLETMAFPAAGHFIVESDGSVVVEYKVSRAISG